MKHLLLFLFLPFVASTQELDLDAPLASDGEAVLSPADKSQAEPAANVPETLAKLQASLSFSDGGVLNGSLCQEHLPVVSDTLGSIRLDLHMVESIAFESAGGPARISFHNGDRLTARIAEDVDNLGVETLLGSLSVPLSSISSFSIAPDVSKVNGQASLLYYCTFDSPTAIEHPAAGPAGRFLGGEFVPGKVGKALRIWSDQPSAEVDFEPGKLGSRGTIEFWAKMERAAPENIFGDGGNPRFFCLWIQDDMGFPGKNPRSSFLQWSGNDGGGRSGLCAMVSGATATTENGVGLRTYPAFLGNPASWHHYAVVWDETGVAGADNTVIVLFLDGKRLVTGGRNDLAKGRNFRRFPESPVLLGFPQRENEHEPSANHVSFLLDEFKIWAVAKTKFMLDYVASGDCSHDNEQQHGTIDKEY